MMRQNMMKNACSEAKDRQSMDGVESGRYRALYEDMVHRLQREEQEHAATRGDRDHWRLEKEKMDSVLCTTKDDIARVEHLLSSYQEEVELKKREVTGLVQEKAEMIREREKMNRDNNSLIRERADLQQ